MEFLIKETAALTPGELLTILAARTKVFVVEQNCAYQEVDARDFQAVHVLLKDHGELVAYARIVPWPAGGAISFGRVLVVAEQRHRHLGRRLVAATLAEIARRDPGQPVRIQAQAYLQEFYAGFGFTATSAVYLEDGIPHLDMVRSVG
ncbi:GNAT family N-acetyltransferase [Lacticaseibacillus parakribbianus]|uniref:GNAT family N-acetyltransferase n=1 Tax=Lacticaseibacillus parakribbianus TaxID=2970927 RepID=UPI0021CB3E9E|nr:GNAT family N-acetyltransferase [Lacticaseibacillus parakribbianus]